MPFNLLLDFSLYICFLSKTILLNPDTVDVLIIGAGPAGLFAASQCKSLDVLVLEKNNSTGKKLLISGTGRCNITHDCATSEFYAHYGQNHRFLKPALNAFSNRDLIAFLNLHGLNTVTDKNGKVFPETQRAEDVLKVLIDACKQNRVDIKCDEAVHSVQRSSIGFTVSTSKGEYHSRFLIITTGGMSYPATGSTGDGYRFAKQLGHAIVPPKPSLSPVIVKDYSMASLAGVALPDRQLSLYRGMKKIGSHEGDIGFTHKGLTGPGILDFSRMIQSGDVLKINFLGIPTDEFRNSLIGFAATDGKTAIQTLLKKMELPRSLVQLVLHSVQVSPDLRLGEITKPIRNLLVAAFCEHEYVVERVAGFNMAMVTAGGVDLEEVNAKTLESKLVEGLFFAGEVLDIDGDTGGYNLQAAFSTAFLAAKCICRGKERF